MISFAHIRQLGNVGCSLSEGEVDDNVVYLRYILKRNGIDGIESDVYKIDKVYPSEDMYSILTVYTYIGYDMRPTQAKVVIRPTPEGELARLV